MDKLAIPSSLVHSTYYVVYTRILGIVDLPTFLGFTIHKRYPIGSIGSNVVPLVNFTAKRGS